MNLVAQKARYEGRLRPVKAMARTGVSLDDYGAQQKKEEKGVSFSGGAGTGLSSRHRGACELPRIEHDMKVVPVVVKALRKPCTSGDPLRRSAFDAASVSQVFVHSP